MLLTFKNKAGNNVVVKAVDIRNIVEMEVDGQQVCQLLEDQPNENSPKFYYSVDTIEELKDRWYYALREWVHGKHRFEA